MSQTAVETSFKGTSPRSTIILVGDHTMNPEDASVAGDKVGGGAKGASAPPEPENTKGENDSETKAAPNQKKGSGGSGEDEPLTPNTDSNLQSSSQVASAPGTRGGTAFYGYPPTGGQPQLTPRYYIGDGFAPAPFVVNPFTNANPSPLSPPRTTVSGAVIPPASPLFPRLNNNGNTGLGSTTSALQQGDRSNSGVVGNPPGSPSFGYAGLGYVSYSQEESSSWAGERNSQPPHSISPQVNSQGIQGTYGISRATSGGRAYSFEDTMQLPSAILPSDGSVAHDMQPPHHQTGNPAYSPYGGSTTSSTNGTLFATHQQWGGAYSGMVPPPDMYGTTPASPLQPRPAHQLQMPPPHHHMGYPPGAGLPMGMRPMGPPGGQYGGFPSFGATSSPGPPIQTTASNKGPDGANLFIFHIPNHFTNLDMYQLFEPYGNLLSVRIMVEKDTGRSRGFGFVSYDSPESAALAIKALNGFVIGNKRLKVQHKQIRPKDMHERDQQGAYGPPIDGYPSPYHQPNHLNALPTPGAPGWYNASDRAGMDQGGHHGKEDQTELTSTSTSGETPNYCGPTGDQALSPLVNLGSLQAALPDVSSGNCGNSPEGTGNSE